MTTIKSLKYSNPELPTLEYTISLQGSSKIDYGTPASKYWLYLKNDQLKLISDIINYSISENDERVFGGFGFKIQNLMSSIVHSKNLTDFQKNEILVEAIFTFNGITHHALKNDITDSIDIISDVLIQEWIKEGNTNLYEKGFYYYIGLLNKLNTEQIRTILYLQEFFRIGSVIIDDIPIDRKITVCQRILDTAFSLFKRENNSPRFKQELQRIVNWFKSIMVQANLLEGISKKYEEILQQIRAGYDSDE